MRRLALFLALLPALLRAQDDWLSLPVPQPLSGTARMEVGLSVHSAEYQGWIRGRDEAWFNTAVGVTRTLKSVGADLILRGKVAGPLVLEAKIPLVFNEFSTPDDGSPQIYSPLDPTVLREQGLGDIQLGLRGPLFGRPGGLQGGWSLGLVAPTGLGPFDAKDPLLATGDGRWQALGALVLGGGQDRAIESWLWAQGRYQAGRMAWVSSQAYLAYDGDGYNEVPVAPKLSGTVWLDPRWGFDASYGLAWNWYRDAEVRHSLAVEFLGHGLSAWSMDGQDQGLGSEFGLWVQPELIMRFGQFNACGGWRSSPILSSYNVPGAYSGTLIVNASYAF